MVLRVSPAPGWRRGRRVRAAVGFALTATLAALLPLRSAHADLIVPAGGTYTTNAGQTDLACTDVVVAGTLTVDGGLVNVRHLTIQPGGTIDGGSGVIQLGGDWTDNGTFNAGTGTVQFADLCALASATISGNTTFLNVSFVSSSGKNYVFAVGSTQTVAGLLTIAGTAGSPIQFRSGTPGQTAFINLLGGGTQAIQHVGVTDVWATGQWLAPLLTNEGGGGNASRWFGVPTPTGPARPVPALADLATLALAALLAGVGIVHLRQRRKLSRARRPHHD
jgi:hypothetical protein